MDEIIDITKINKIHVDSYMTKEDKDIKKLESYLNGDKIYDIELDKLIKNLIARYKELEENRKLTARKYMLNAETGELKEIPIDNNYIPKSKVQEKIEDLEKRGYFEEANAMKDLLED